MSDTISVRVCLFARLREICGQSEIEMHLPRGNDAGACFAELISRWPGLAEQRQALAVAVNEEYAEWGTVLAEGDVVTFIAPVSGG